MVRVAPFFLTHGVYTGATKDNSAGLFLEV